MPIRLSAPAWRQLLPQLADEDVDDLHLGFVHAAIEVVEERLLGQDHPLAQNQQFQDRVFLAGQVHRLAVHRHLVRAQIEQQRADRSVGWLKPLLRRTTAWMRASSSALSKGLVMKSSAPRPKPFTLACGRDSPDRMSTGVSFRETRIRRTTSIALDVRQHQVQYHDVVVVVPGELEAFLAGIDMVDHGAVAFSISDDAAGRDEIVFNEQDTHLRLLHRLTA